ncbi:MAG: hypothetical protein RL380_398 [Verrucomicrobiota bacterium]|jgi:hypothetical protein
MNRKSFLAVTCATLLAVEFGRAAAVEEVRELLLQNLPGVTAAQLDGAELDGILAAFTNQVRWQPASAPTNSSLAPLVSRAVIVEGDLALLRVGRVAAGLEAALMAAQKNLVATNKISGVVVDLRFADGDDDAAATRAAAMLTNTPRVALINAATHGAAVVLAEALRARRTLLLGAPTAGGWRTFTLTDGQRLQLADGNSATPRLVPDIAVNVPSETELKFFADAYATVTRTNLTGNEYGTNIVPRRVSEADLVRARREGLADPEEELANETTASAVPTRVLQDAALARAVDLLHGLARWQMP